MSEPQPSAPSRKPLYGAIVALVFVGAVGTGLYFRYARPQPQATPPPRGHGSERRHPARPLGKNEGCDGSQAPAHRRPGDPRARELVGRCPTSPSSRSGPPPRASPSTSPPPSPTSPTTARTTARFRTTTGSRTSSGGSYSCSRWWRKVPRPSLSSHPCKRARLQHGSREGADRKGHSVATRSITMRHGERSCRQRARPNQKQQ